MLERINDYDKDKRLARKQSSAVSEHSDETGHYLVSAEVKIIDRDPHCYTRKVKERIHISLYPENINGYSGIMDAQEHNTHSVLMQAT